MYDREKVIASTISFINPFSKQCSVSKCAVQKHLEQIAPQFRKEILDGGTFTKMVRIVAIGL